MLGGLALHAPGVDEHAAQGGRPRQARHPTPLRPYALHLQGMITSFHSFIEHHYQISCFSSQDYGVYLEDNGHTLRGLFIIDDRGVLRQITMNDLPVGRSVDETLRLVQAFQVPDLEPMVLHPPDFPQP